MLNHPFLTSVNAHQSMAAYLQKRMASLDDYNTRSLELSEQTTNLISLIFNIATLQDTRVAVEESRIANVLAASIRRVTVLTFIYLPLMLSAVCDWLPSLDLPSMSYNPKTKRPHRHRSSLCLSLLLFIRCQEIQGRAYSLVSLIIRVGLWDIVSVIYSLIRLIPSVHIPRLLFMFIPPILHAASRSLSQWAVR